MILSAATLRLWTQDYESHLDVDSIYFTKCVPVLPLIADVALLR